MDDRDLERRLAGYRPIVERAIARRPLAPREDRDRRRWVVSTVAAATVAAGVVGWIALGGRDEPASTGSQATTTESGHVTVDSGDSPEPTSPEVWAEPCSSSGDFHVTGATLLDDADHLLPDVWVYGDSVMASADPLLLAAGYGTNVSVSRQFSDLLQLAPVACATRDYQTIVIHLGNSGPIDTRDLDVVMTSLADVPRVVVLTLYNSNGTWLNANNDLLRALPADYRNVIVLDWEVLARQCVNDCFATDEFHLTETGAEFYTELITNLVDITTERAP